MGARDARLVSKLAVLMSAIIEAPALLLGRDLDLGGGEEDVERLAEADGQANERHQRHVQRARLDFLEVLPVHVAPLGGFFEGPAGGMAESANPSPERPLLLLEASGASVGLGRSLRLGGGHAARPSGFRPVLNTSHVTINGLTSFVPSGTIGSWAQKLDEHRSLTGAEDGRRKRA